MNIPRIGVLHPRPMLMLLLGSDISCLIHFICFFFHRNDYGYLGPSLQTMVAKQRTSPTAGGSGSTVAVVTCTPPLVPASGTTASASPTVPKTIGVYSMSFVWTIVSQSLYGQYEKNNEVHNIKGLTSPIDCLTLWNPLNIDHQCLWLYLR